MKSKIHLLLTLFPLLVATDIARAGSAKWNLNPASSDWNTAANWTPGTVPNGPADTATFGVSNTTNPSLSASVEVDEITFDPSASAGTFSTSQEIGFTVSGAGITNNSGVVQKFTNHGTIDTFSPGFITFTNNASAGSQTDFTNEGGNQSGGSIEFHDSSTAGSATFTNFDSTVVGAGGGTVLFLDSSTAGNGTFTNDGSTVGNTGSTVISFFDRSTAGNGIFTLNGSQVQIGGVGIMGFFGNSSASHGTFNVKGGSGQVGGGAVYFYDNSRASRATLIATGGRGQGGTLVFLGDSRGGKARVETFDNGTLDISGHNLPGVSLGSIEGGGVVVLGANHLAIGSNNLSTIFAGVIQDGDADTGGSLGKGGTGNLTLANANTYTGGTTIDQGTLLIRNSSGSATGTGAVQVNAGTFGGNGIIAGTVTVGTGSGSGAALSPGKNATNVGLLTILNALTFNSDATYTFGLNSDSATADEVMANGVTIGTGAQFSFVGLGNARLPPGTSFTAISNTTATPIAGAFANLADGSTLTVGNNTFQADYQSGDGNDLTLTVAP